MKEFIARLRAWSQNMRTKYPYLSKIVGIVLIVIGLLALVTPVTPGAWLALIGLEMLGIHLTFLKPIGEWLERKGWWR